MVQYRQAERPDIPAMARIRAAQWETEEYWNVRITRYLDCELHPQQALIPRIIYTAWEDGTLAGFIAGHLTRRFDCQGELEWIDVILEKRRSGIGFGLLLLLAQWFVEQQAMRICVDVNPANTTARLFYRRHGAVELNPHWLVWNDISTALGHDGASS